MTAQIATLPADDLPLAISARMSLDSAAGIARQLEDCHAEAAKHLGSEGKSLPVVEYIDDGVSATKRKPRPGYDRLMVALRAGEHRKAIVFDQTRLTRKPREIEDWLDLREERGVAVIVPGGQDLLADAFAFGVKGQLSRQEVVQLKTRLRRSLVQRAESGRPHGRPAYGWQADLIGPERQPGDDKAPRRMRAGRDELDPVAAKVIRETAQRLLAGESLRSITIALNDCGATTASGGTWTPQQLRTIMLRLRNAGVRMHLGEEVGPGDWPAIYDRGTHDRVVALLTDPVRKTNSGAPPRHLLSKLALCGRCKTNSMVVNPGHNRRPAYVCAKCHKVSRVQQPVDDMVAGMVVARLMQPDALDALTTRADPADTAKARAEIAELNARLDLAADSYADGKLNHAQLERITGKLTPQIEAAKAKVTASLPRADLAPMAGPDAFAKWQAASLDVRRLVIDTLMTAIVVIALLAVFRQQVVTAVQNAFESVSNAR